jgi:hypothetical protein
LWGGRRASSAFARCSPGCPKLHLACGLPHKGEVPARAAGRLRLDDADPLKIWFGIITLSVVEIGLITPPVGLNVFVINALARDVPMADTFRGVVPFLLSDVVRVSLIVAFPTLSLLLPRLLG